MTHPTPTEHLVRISKLVARPGQLKPWVMVCGSCPWADAATTRDEAVQAADAHAARPEGRD